jgi:two-component system, OmpR family, sensor kinase
MSRLPIRLRLTLAFAVVMAAVLGAMGLLVYDRVGAALLGSIDQTLRPQAAEALRHTADDRGLVDPDASSGVTLAEILDVRGHVVRSTPAKLAPLLGVGDVARVAGRRRITRNVKVYGQRGEWRVLAVPADNGAVVAVARSLEPYDETLDHLLRELMIAEPLALLLASLAGYGLAAGALRPVEAMRRRAAAVTAAAPGRLPVPRSGDELSRLAETLNDMLGRLQASLEHERRFVADASHELRTPLALLRTELELALRRPRSGPELEHAVRSAAEETERLSRLADDLLWIARADQGALPLRQGRIAAGELLDRVARRFARRAATEQRTLTVERSDAVVDADPDRVEQALSNLVENALSHGAGDVVLFARRAADAVELHVVDHGPGVPESFQERAFDRFSRADEARGRGGAGLGLSIVGLVAQAHGGAASVANRPEGGADVWLTLPAALS